MGKLQDQIRKDEQEIGKLEYIFVYDSEGYICCGSYTPSLAASNNEFTVAYSMAIFEDQMYCVRRLIEKQLGESSPDFYSAYRVTQHSYVKFMYHFTARMIDKDIWTIEDHYSTVKNPSKLREDPREFGNTRVSIQYGELVSEIVGTPYKIELDLDEKIARLPHGEWWFKNMDQQVLQGLLDEALSFLREHGFEYLEYLDYYSKSRRHMGLSNMPFLAHYIQDMEVIYDPHNTVYRIMRKPL